MPFLVPLLAQSVTLAVGDRTEVRLAIIEEQRIPELETTPTAAILVSGKRTDAVIGYAPVLTVTPLDSRAQLITFHRVNLTDTTRIAPRTTLRLNGMGGYGLQNFFVSSLASSGATQGTPTEDDGEGEGEAGEGAQGQAQSGASGQRAAARQTVRFGTARAEAGVNHTVSRRTWFTTTAGYEVSGGLDTDAASREAYPKIQGPDLNLSYDYQITQKGQLSTFGRTEYDWSSLGTRVVTAELGEGYSHRFSENLTLGASVGAGIARTESEDGSVDVLLYPTLGLGSAGLLQWETRVGGGVFSLEGGISYAPALDSVTAVLDQRLGLRAGANYVRDRTTVYANGSGTISLTPTEQGALNGVTAEGGVQYDLGQGFQLDGGGRGAWQSFQQATTIPFSYALFIGLAWGASYRL